MIMLTFTQHIPSQKSCLHWTSAVRRPEPWLHCIHCIYCFLFCKIGQNLEHPTWIIHQNVVPSHLGRLQESSKHLLSVDIYLIPLSRAVWNKAMVLGHGSPPSRDGKHSATWVHWEHMGLKKFWKSAKKKSEWCAKFRPERLASARNASSCKLPAPQFIKGFHIQSMSCHYGGTWPMF